MKIQKYDYVLYSTSSGSTVELFGTEIEESLTLCEPKDVEYSINSSSESLGMKII